MLWSYDQVTWTALLMLAWCLPLKGLAMWEASKHGHKAWFVFFLLVNALALPEIIYLVYVRPRRPGYGLFG